MSQIDLQPQAYSQSKIKTTKTPFAFNGATPLEIYVNQNTIYFGFGSKLYQAGVTYDVYYNKRVTADDIKITGVANNATSANRGEFLRLLQSSELTIKHSDQAVHKRYIWDNDDCIEKPLGLIRVSDIVLINDKPYVVQHIDFAELELTLINPETNQLEKHLLDEVQHGMVYRCFTL